MAAVRFPHVLHRGKYLLWWIVYAVGFSVFLGLIAALLGPAVQDSSDTKFFRLGILLPLIAVGIVFKMVLLDAPRARSMGWSPWMVILLAVPILGGIVQLLLFIIPPKQP